MQAAHSIFVKLTAFVTVEKIKEVITSFAGLPLVLETMKAMKIPELARNDIKIKQKERGIYSEGDYIESFIDLIASGGECLEDMERLRADEGLKKVGLKVPSSESGRFYLYAFHDEELLNKGRPAKEAFVPEETPQLKGLLEANEGLIKRATKKLFSVIATIPEFNSGEKGGWKDGEETMDEG